MIVGGVNMANCSNCIRENDCVGNGKTSGYCGAYRPVKVTNREYFFGDKMIADTIMLLTYDNHQREECRIFKKELGSMRTRELIEWLDSPKDRRFNW